MEARHENPQQEPQQLREFRTQFQADPELCGRVLYALGEPPEELGMVIVKAPPELVDRAISRCLALACHGVLARIELL